MSYKSETISSVGKVWQFVRCAVDLTNQKFYLRNNAIQNIVPEVLSQGISNVIAYRFFDVSTTTTVRVENAGLNKKARIFLRGLNLYREYLPQSTMKMQYR